MKKNLIISTIMLIVILMNTVSYAATEVTVEKLEESLRKIFSKDIEISYNSEGETSSSTIEAVNVEIGESKITIKEEGAEKFEPINYVIEDNICKFNHKYTINITEDSGMEEALKEMAMILMQQLMLMDGYLATADAVGIDLSLAYTYFQQIGTEKAKEEITETTEKYSVVDEVFSMEIIVSETQYTSSLEVNLEKLAELDESDINPNEKYAITLVEHTEDEEQPKEEIEEETDPQPEEEKKEEDKEDEKQDVVVVVPNDTKKEDVDDTQAKTEIPKAGAKNIICITLIILMVVCVLYIKNKKYEDIK